MQYRTDLAIEQAANAGSTGGICMHTARMGVFTRTEVEVQSLEAARRLGKPMGRYITFETAPVHSLDQTTREALSGQISCAVRELLPPLAMCWWWVWKTGTSPPTRWAAGYAKACW